MAGSVNKQSPSKAPSGPHQGIAFDQFPFVSAGLEFAVIVPLLLLGPLPSCVQILLAVPLLRAVLWLALAATQLSTVLQHPPWVLPLALLHPLDLLCLITMLLALAALIHRSGLSFSCFSTLHRVLLLVIVTEVSRYLLCLCTFFLLFHFFVFCKSRHGFLMLCCCI